MKVVYKTEVESQGGRQGKVRSRDGYLELELSVPGSPEPAGSTRKPTNPEQLFAAGYAACFENAIIHVARRQKIVFNSTRVVGRVSLLSFPEGHFNISVELDVDLGDLDAQQAADLIRTAHKVCPYSNATRGNIDMTLLYKGQSLATASV